jgi:hypothetical protein
MARRVKSLLQSMHRSFKGPAGALIVLPRLINCLLSKFACGSREGGFEQFLKPAATLAICFARLVCWIYRDYCLLGYNAGAK